MSKGKHAIPIKLTGIDNTASKAAVTVPDNQPKHIVRLFRLILSELNGVQLCQQDSHAILLLAKNLDVIQTADRELAKTGYVIETKTGYQQPNPWVAIRNKAETQAVKLLRQLGMTPAARAATGAKPKQERQDPLDQFLNAG